MKFIAQLCELLGITSHISVWLLWNRVYCERHYTNKVYLTCEQYCNNKLTYHKWLQKGVNFYISCHDGQTDRHFVWDLQPLQPKNKYRRMICRWPVRCLPHKIKTNMNYKLWLTTLDVNIGSCSFVLKACASAVAVGGRQSHGSDSCSCCWSKAFDEHGADSLTSEFGHLFIFYCCL